ncbi:MAG: DUF1256 domain-containing protein, partial [Bacillota bacterium]
MKIRFDPGKDLPGQLGRHLAKMCWPSSFEVVCIGTDRSTGDALGPLIGSILQTECDEVSTWGSIDSPIHAANLHEFMEEYRPPAP